MNPDPMHVFDFRLQKLEQRNRSLLFALIFSIAAFAGLGLIGCAYYAQSAPARLEVRAERFVLVDAQNRVMGTWSREGDSTVLRFGADATGQRLLLNVSPTTSGVGVYAPGSYPRGVLSVDRDDGGQLIMVGVPGGAQVQATEDTLLQDAVAHGVTSVANLRVGSLTKFILEQQRLGRVELSAGQAVPNGDGPELCLGEPDRVRVSLGKPKQSASNWRLEFRDTNNTPTYQIPPAKPEN
jgi:hypothetical protein